VTYIYSVTYTFFLKKKQESFNHNYNGPSFIGLCINAETMDVMGCGDFPCHRYVVNEWNNYMVYAL